MTLITGVKNSIVLYKLSQINCVNSHSFEHLQFPQRFASLDLDVFTHVTALMMNLVILLPVHVRMDATRVDTGYHGQDLRAKQVRRACLESYKTYHRQGPSITSKYIHICLGSYYDTTITLCNPEWRGRGGADGFAPHPHQNICSYVFNLKSTLRNIFISLRNVTCQSTVEFFSSCSFNVKCNLANVRNGISY